MITHLIVPKSPMIPSFLERPGRHIRSLMWVCGMNGVRITDLEGSLSKTCFSQNHNHLRSKSLADPSARIRVAFEIPIRVKSTQGNLLCLSCSKTLRLFVLDE